MEILILLYLSSQSSHMFQSSGPPPVPLVLHAVREDADGSGGDQHFRFGVNVNICTFWADQTYFISTSRQEQQRKQPSKQTPEALRRIFCTPYHLKLLPRTENNASQKWAEMDWMLSECFSDSALGESRTTWPAECKAELLTDRNEDRNKPKGLWYSHTLFICKKDFSTKHQNAAWMNKHCVVKAFSDRLKHIRHDSAALNIELKCICFLFFLSYLYVSLSYVCFDTVCCPIAVMSHLWHFWMNLVVYILSHAMFSKGMLH